MDRVLDQLLGDDRGHRHARRDLRHRGADWPLRGERDHDPLRLGDGGPQPDH